jgi:hypothetical protein
MSKARGVRELKTRLGSYLREVRRGQTIVVTDRGEPGAGAHKRVAVKIVDDRGIESLKIIPTP